MYNHPKASKGQSHKSLASLQKAWEILTKTPSEIAKTIWKTTEWLYHLINSWDLAIHSALWKSSNKIVDFTKRNILKILIAWSILTTSWAMIYPNPKDKKNIDIEIVQHTKTIDTKKILTPEALKGKNVWDLYSHYLWYNWNVSKIWDTILFNPQKILQELYARKFKRDNNKGFTVAKDFYENTVSYIDFTGINPSNFQQLKNNITRSIDEVNKHLDRDKFWKDKLKGNPEKIQLFKNICHKIDEKCLLAYGMTELMPSADWNLNKDILDFLLQHGWEEFVMNLPAVADDYTSFWLYQFTSFAIYDTWNRQEWSSVVNLYLPENKRIPGSVTKLEWQNHHKAAYLFAIYNLYTLVQKADGQMIKALKLLADQKDNNDLAQLIAIMHNLPSSGTKFLMERYKLQHDTNYLKKMTHNKKWKKIYEYDTNKNWKIDLYESLLLPKASHNYWKKTYYNRKTQ